jgi:hypothetical protein
MRKPTPKEQFLLKMTLEGLQEDIRVLCARPEDDVPQDITFHDILGTFGANLHVLQGIRTRMLDESETTRG